MSHSEIDLFSLKLKNFLENDFKKNLDNINLLKISIRNNFIKRIYISLAIIISLIIIFILCKTILHNYYDNLISHHKIIEANYYKWYKEKSMTIRFFLPSYIIFFTSPSPFKIIIISLFILPIWCIIALFKNDLPKENLLFEDFFKFYDIEAKTILYQKLLYSPNIKNNLTLNNDQNIKLEDNIQFKLDDSIIDIAQIYMSNMTDNINFLKLAKNILYYRAIIISTPIKIKENRVTKILIGDIDKFDYKNFESLEKISYNDIDSNIQVKIFSSDPTEIFYWQQDKELIKFFNAIQQYNDPTSIYYDQIVRSLINNNLKENLIKLQKIIEITIGPDYLTIIIPTTHRILYNKSVFDDKPGINDCYFIAASVKMFKQLLKKLKTIY